MRHGQRPPKFQRILAVCGGGGVDGAIRSRCALEGLGTSEKSPLCPFSSAGAAPRRPPVPVVLPDSAVHEVRNLTA